MEDLRLVLPRESYGVTILTLFFQHKQKKTISEQNRFMHNKVRENSWLYRSGKGPHQAQNHSG